MEKIAPIKRIPSALGSSPQSGMSPTRSNTMVSPRKSITGATI
jgi:hypothetical protein